MIMMIILIMMMTLIMMVMVIKMMMILMTTTMIMIVMMNMIVMMIGKESGFSQNKTANGASAFVQSVSADLDLIRVMIIIINCLSLVFLLDFLNILKNFH